MINFYDKLSKEDKSETKLDKHFKNHYILPNSMIGIIGGTGSGKSNALLNLISKQSNKYFDIIIFNPVSVDEPLLKLLQKKIPELKLISNIEELPSLSEFVGDSDHEKLIVFDDVINMSTKDFNGTNTRYATEILNQKNERYLALIFENALVCVWLSIFCQALQDTRYLGEA